MAKLVGYLARYETIVRRNLAPRLGGNRLDRLRPPDIQSWINEIARTVRSGDPSRGAGTLK
jgi:hypothetical protein